VDTISGIETNPYFSTGLPGLDDILHGIQPGDNIVWQVEAVNDYLPFVQALCRHARQNGKKVIYFRFARHRELVSSDQVTERVELHPGEGLEQFITHIHEVIDRTGGHACYIFDSLSDLALDYFSERMIGNFFMLTCPLLLKLSAMGYFMVLRYYHSHHASAPIESTTQILLNVYSYMGKTYVHPLKVAKRYSPTMFMLHSWEGDEFRPVMESATITSVVTSGPWHGLQSASYRMVGMWDRRFIEAEDVLMTHARGGCAPEVVDRIFERQLKQVISRDERILSLARKYLALPDLIHIWKRTIGSGLIGGKAVGMLLARAILKASNERWKAILEAHDSFFIGSDIFYSFIVQNGCWDIRRKQMKAETLFEDIEEGRQRILEGVFPDYIIKRFSDMLDYFGQCPIIVRSSSLLEDNFGNAFSGKYESVFCVNQGTHEERLEAFLGAVRHVYASTMSREALAYRAKRGVLDRDEQMALLVQRVSGMQCGDLFFPHLAGVGVSYNSYAWDAAIDPDAGLLRLVFGLGTRAVERHDDDYTRLVALNTPEKRPEGDEEEIRHYTQRKVDLLDLGENVLRAGYFMDVVHECPGVPVNLFSVADESGQEHAGDEHRLIAFDHIFRQTRFTQDMREMLSVLRKTYECHVDVEFTANFQGDGRYKINLLQCRPLQVRSEMTGADAMPEIQPDHVLLKARGGIVGTGRVVSVDRIIYIVPSAYGQLAERERHEVARLVGRLTHCKPPHAAKSILLLGPGRWGTRMASLGVPVSFSEINTVSVICEIARMHERLMPDLSLGTHYFNDIVEMGMLYIGLSPSKEGCVINESLLLSLPNRLTDLMPDAAALADVVKVVHGSEVRGDERIILRADSMKQVAMVYQGRD
jgi:hypothetical protein